MKNLVILSSVIFSLMILSCSKDEICPTDVLDGKYVKIVSEGTAPNSYDTITVTSTNSSISVSNFSYWDSSVSFNLKGKSDQYGNPLAFRTFEFIKKCDFIGIIQTTTTLFASNKTSSARYRKIE